MASLKSLHVMHAQSGEAGDTYQPPRKPGRRPRLLAKRPVRPGDTFGVPGHGSSALTSLVTIAALLGLWFAATYWHWVKPLFLPSPLAVYNKFILVATEGFANSTLAQHTGISLLRVFGAFALACVTRFRSA